MGAVSRDFPRPIYFYKLGLITFSGQMRTRTRKMRTHAHTKLLSVGRRERWGVVT